MVDPNKEGRARNVVVDRAWTGLDHECAVRMSGRQYRPGRLYDRPQESERHTAGEPQDVHGREGARPESPGRVRSSRAVTACPGGAKQADGGEV